MFVGGFTREAALQAMGVPLNGLRRLLDASMLGREGGRYAFHPLTQQFLRKRLQEDAQHDREARRRHATYFLAFAETVKPHLTGEEQRQWSDLLNLDLDNLRSALAWSLEQQDAALALPLVSALSNFWFRRAYIQEAKQWLVRALALTGGEDTTRVAACEAVGYVYQDLGEVDLARYYLLEGLALSERLGNEHPRGLLTMLGIVAYRETDYDAASDYLYRALEASSGVKAERGASYTQHAGCP